MAKRNGSVKQPTPTDEISSLAGKILRLPHIDLEKIRQGAGVTLGIEHYAELLVDAKKLAGFVLNADPHAGANVG